MLINNYKTTLNFVRTFDVTFLIKSNKDKYKVAQRVLSFKKKTWLTVMNMHSKLLDNHGVHPPLSTWEGGSTKFSKRGRLGRTLFLRGGLLGKKGMILFKEVAVFT